MKSFLSNDFLESLGIVDFGYTESAEALSYKKFEKWISEKMHGELKYLEGERGDKRENIKKVFPKFKSALVFLFDYPKAPVGDNNLKIASYALGFQGKDYHFVIKERLERMASKLNESFDFDYKISLDIEPVLERDLAFRAGLGWFGRNSMLINKKHGSYFLIGSLLLSIKLENQVDVLLKGMETDHCGTCRKCIDLCPTKAIKEDRTLELAKCISNFTIETFKEVDPPENYNEVESEIFGCDICQEVCPWNHKIELDNENESFITEFFLKRSVDKILNQLDAMSNREYKRIFYGTALERPGRIGMIKNLKALKAS